MFKVDEPLYLHLRSRDNLLSAWRVIQQNGLQSKSEKTRAEVRRFAEIADREISRIARDLQKGTFRFSPQLGVLLKQPGKKKLRPIVKAPVPNRVVQRAILNVLMKVEGIQAYVLNPYSFGSLPERDIAKGIGAVQASIKQSSNYFIRSDISGFFTKIPRRDVISKISACVSDSQFLKVTEEAIAVELSNLADLKAGADAFPIYEIGVAQGSCLSPLAGNLLLSDFDRQMNARGISCFRYVDDFIILGPDRRSVRKAFASACAALSCFDMSAYDPEANPEKAEEGLTHNGLEFLGCRILPGLVRPSDKSQRKLIAGILEKLQGLNSTRPNSSHSKRKAEGFAYKIFNISESIHSWRSAYKFCNDGQAMLNLDKKIDELIAKAFREFAKAADSATSEAIRNALGVARVASQG